MESLRAGYEKLRKRTERVGDKVMKQALNSGVVRVGHGLTTGKQYTIRGRTVVEEHQISEGGFAFVWAVRDSRTGEDLALKKILCQDREGLAMAKREVDLLERLPDHPNIVKYYGHTICDTDSHAKEVLLLFELCSGGHLLHLLERHKGVLSEEQIVKVLSDICMAVSLLHLQDPPIQHRDLKVENILLGSDGSYKLCDFGSWSDESADLSELTKQQSAALQEQIERYTTMMYRPPEMVDFYQPFTISEKVDMWMLGCILFTLLFYRHPFQDESTLAISNARYMVPSSPQVSDRLLDLVHWLLARDPSQRPKSVQLLEIFQNFESGASIPLPRPVVEKREQLRRLYGDQPLTPVSASVPLGPSSPSATASEDHAAPGKKATKSKQHHQHHHKHAKRQERKEEPVVDGGSFWAKADLQVTAANPWPPVSVPEPSRAWATFDASPTPAPGPCATFDAVAVPAPAPGPCAAFEGSNVHAAVPAPAPCAAFEGSSPVHAPTPAPCAFDGSPVHAPAPAPCDLFSDTTFARAASHAESTCGVPGPGDALSRQDTSSARVASHADSTSGAPGPGDALSRQDMTFARPPSHPESNPLSRQESPVSVRSGGSVKGEKIRWSPWAEQPGTSVASVLVTSRTNEGSSSRPPLAHSGHSSKSSKSGKSNTSLRSASAASARSASHGSPLSKMTQRPAGSLAPAPHDVAGDFWSLAAADSPNQPWDPFAQNVQWPGLPVTARATASASASGSQSRDVSPRLSLTPPRRQHTALLSEGRDALGAWMPWSTDGRFQQQPFGPLSTASASATLKSRKPRSPAPFEQLVDAAPQSQSGHRRTASAPSTGRQPGQQATQAAQDLLASSSPVSGEGRDGPGASARTPTPRANRAVKSGGGAPPPQTNSQGFPCDAAPGVLSGLLGQRQSRTTSF